MPKYRLTVSEIYYIEADSETEAIEIFEDLEEFGEHHDFFDHGGIDAEKVADD